MFFIIIRKLLRKWFAEINNFLIDISHVVKQPHVEKQPRVERQLYVAIKIMVTN